MTSPRLIKGGLVQVEPASGRLLGVIALQYNPDTLTRNLQVQSSGGDGADPYGVGGARVRPDVSTDQGFTERG